MKISQPGVARQRYPGVNADAFTTLKGLYRRTRHLFTEDFGGPEFQP